MAMKTDADRSADAAGRGRVATARCNAVASLHERLPACSLGRIVPRVRSVWFSLLTLCTALSCFPACSQGGRNPGDIVLITIDTLRPDHMSVYGYSRATTPEIDRWFAAGRIFERAYATSSYTTASVVSILSGLLPQEHGVRLFDQLLDEQCVTITELLPPSYQTAAFVSNGVLTDKAIGLARRFDHFDDLVTRDEPALPLERSATQTTDAAIAWLREQRDPDRPLFLWIHYMDPHAPYAAPPAWQDRFDHVAEGAAAPQPNVLDLAEPPVQEYLARIDAYDREIAYTDAEVGRLLTAYRESGKLARALVMLTADHGETLTERATWFQHAIHVYEEQLRVPLLMMGPGVEPGRDQTRTSSLDLLPTMLTFAKVPIPSDVTGHDLATGSVPKDRVLFAESMRRFDKSQWRAAIQGTHKWLVNVADGDPPKLERRYVDLATDPGEERLLAWPSTSPVGDLLLDLIARDPDPAGQPASYRKGLLVAEQADALRKLGYVE